MVYLPLKKYRSTYPRDSKSSRRLCSRKKTAVRVHEDHNSMQNVQDVQVVNSGI